MRRNQVTCDVCDRPAPEETDDWLLVVGVDIVALDFCSFDCLADYARLEALRRDTAMQEPPC